MRHCTPESVPPLFARPPDPPRNDAAPLAGRAGVNGPSDAHNLTRLPLKPPAPHNAPPGTSSVAADRIAGHARNLRARVLAFIVGQGPHGATDDEGEAALGIKPQTYTPRRGELVALGLVADSGRRRNTSSRRPAAVWVAATLATDSTIAPEALAGTGGSEGGAA